MNENPKPYFGRSSFRKEKLDLRPKDNFLVLDDKCSRPHLETLSKMLRTLSRLAYEKMPEIGKGNPTFEQYLYRLADTIDTIKMKNHIETLRTDNLSVSSDCSIDPTDSGFPTIIRDFHLLQKDKEQADDIFKGLRSDKELVNAAMFTLYRGYYPQDIIFKKLERNYYEKLSKLEMADPLKIHPELIVKKDERTKNHFMKKSIEKLDSDNNLPRFYTLYFEVTPPVFSSDIWIKDLEFRINDVLSSVEIYELPALAKSVEEINGLKLELVERFDVGPFYNNKTYNQGAIAELLDDAGDTEAVLTFRRHFVKRVDEKKKQGFWNVIQGYLKKDLYKGSFSEIVQTPKYMLMPHRLIQKAFNQHLDFRDEVKLYGITSGGDFIG